MNTLDKIKNKIREIQNQPEKVKVRIMWTWAIIGTLLIAAGWAIIFKKYEWIPKSNFKPVLSGVKEDLKNNLGEFNNIKNRYLPELRNMVKGEKIKADEAKKNNTN